jgi:hypothetical protein
VKVAPKKPTNALDGGPVSDGGEGSSTPGFTRVLAAPAGHKAALAAPLRPPDVCDIRCATASSFVHRSPPGPLGCVATPA